MDIYFTLSEKDIIKTKQLILMRTRVSYQL